MPSCSNKRVRGVGWITKKKLDYSMVEGQALESFSYRAGSDVSCILSYAGNNPGLVSACFGYARQR